MEKHYKEKLSSYLNHELPQAERQAIAEHLLNCPKCRREHDEIKFGVALASNLERAEAPENTWDEIKNALDRKAPRQTSLLLPQIPFFNSRGLLATAMALLIVFGLATVVFLNLFGGGGGLPQEVAERKLTTPGIQEKPNAPPPPGVAIQTPKEALVNSNVENPANITGTNTNSSSGQFPPVNSNQPGVKPKETTNTPSWQVETIAGAPVSGSQTISKNGTLAVGDFLETDANSRARIAVANIGQVEIAPNSRVQLVRTQSTEHRLSLERGLLQAKILAPPRLFIVDTPSAVAVDLGCEYTLEVDKAGNSRLHVKSGFVALERGGREAIVPAAAICLTRRGQGIGTPFFEGSSPALQAALAKFDFAGGGSASLQTIIKESRSFDTLTLWHLLARVSPAEREKVFDALASFVKPPAGVTREGVLKLDKKMLDRWRLDIEDLWFD